MKTLFTKPFALLLALLGLTLPSQAADYGLPTNIQDGNILHCFDWPVNDVKSALPQIAAAGFGAVQISPVQRPDARQGMEWHALYRPYDLAFKSSSYCSEQDLQSLCQEAANYGIKVIVDVVANHVDRSSGYHDTWWDNNGRVRWNGGINYGDRYSITHGQLGDYGDVNSEDSEVIARAKSFVEKLKSLGVKGIRWDAAKHIGLPSEGCNFWSSVTSVPGVWHYGEILDDPGPNRGIIREYAQLMSVTDNRYSNEAARNNGGIPNNANGQWISNENVDASKVVYWGESHDTYSNDEWSQNVDQSVIDRAYCSMACRNGATALYFSRPNQKGFGNIKVGKGSTAFTAKHIAAVNKFRNAMTGRADNCRNDGNCFVVTRKDGGAVIVSKGSGQVNVNNVGGYCPAGTYKDMVSGNTFTVTSSNISGNIGNSGVVVLMKDGVTPDDPGHDDPTPPEPDPNRPVPNAEYYVYFDNSVNWDVKVWAWNDSENCCTNDSWPGDGMTQEKGWYYWTAPAGKVPTMIIFSNNGNEKAGGDLPFVNKAIYHSDGSYTQTSDDPNPGPNPDDPDDPNPGPTPDPNNFRIYYDNSLTGWPQVNIHYWSAPETNWPGVAMTHVTENLWCYTFTQDPSMLSGFLFCDGTGGNGTCQTDDYLGAPSNGHLYKGAGGDRGPVTDEGMCSVEEIAAESDEAPVYFTLQGIRISAPTAPGLYIVKQGAKTTKRLVRP